MATFSISVDKDITVTHSLLTLVLRPTGMKLDININDRLNNKDVVAEIERHAHWFIGRPIDHDTCTELHSVLAPLLGRLQHAKIAGVQI